MKRWKCTVCGYIHTGDEPPEECPVCGADKSLFVEINEDGSEVTANEEKAPEPPKADHWKCSVCGYQHKGDEPPEECPVCGSDKSRFFPAKDEGARQIDSLQSSISEKEPDPKKETAAESPSFKDPPWLRRLRAISYPPWLDRITKEMPRWHVHPISVHLPNGVFPVSVLFMMLAMISGSSAFSKAAFYNLIIVLLAMPMVLFSGYNDWQRRFGGHLTRLFHIKIICGAVVLAGTFVLSLWWAISPEILISGGSGRWVFILFALITLGAAITAGYMGGKLVFLDKD